MQFANEEINEEISKEEVSNNQEENKNPSSYQGTEGAKTDGRTLVKKRPAGTATKKPGTKKPGAKPPTRPAGAKPPVKKGPKKAVNVGDVKLPKGLKLVEQVDDEAEEKKKKKKKKVRKKPKKVNVEELKPVVTAKVKLKKKKKKDIKLLEKSFKKSGRIVPKKHLNKIRKGLEVPRYTVKPQYGLTYEIVESRIDDGLANINLVSASKSYKMIFITNIITFFNFISLGIVGWLITVGAWTDLAFGLIIAANIVLGIYQEIKAKRTVDRLSILSSPTTFVMREGEKQEILTTDIVLDDVIVLESGNQIVADSKIIDGYVEVNESMLTGESDALVKKAGDIIYGGSYIVSGIAKAQVEHIGKDNYVEKLTNQVRKHKKPKSELSKSINLIIRILSVLVIVVGALLFYIQWYLNGVPYVSAVRSTAGAMVGIIPAGLVLISSLALYIGVIKLAEFNVLVRELHCIEMLARVNVLCLDKTGTITDGTMTVERVIDYRPVPGLTTKGIMSAMLNALNDRNSTSKALEEKFGLGKRMRHDAIMPFSSVRKYSAVDFGRNGTFVLGAPEVILSHNFGIIQKDFERFSKKGFRLLLLAHSKSRILDNNVDLTTFNPVAVILIEDNIRPDAIETIDYFKKSGVDVKVISGDNPMTVSKISERAGIDNASMYISLDGLSEKEVIDSANKFTVFGRVSPAQKRLLVRTLKSQGKTVAMTGDGVNDILALKEADCSIAVASGADAAKAVSHLVLLDSDFSSMPRVVREGRRVINNIARVATLFLTRSIFSLFLAIQAIQTQGVFPISPIQLMLIDVLVIAGPSMILILEPNNAKVAGSFLKKIIKKALPGAITVLTIAYVVYMFKEPLNLDTRQHSTIIVITATFAMMMVLLDMCTPLNKARKNMMTIIVGVFTMFVVLFPALFDFSPLTPIGMYEDERQIQRIPVRGKDTVTFSDKDYIVVNNRVTNVTPLDLNNQTPTIQGGFVNVFGQKTNYRLMLPTRFSNTFAGNLVFDPNTTSLEVTATSNGRVEVRKDGNVILRIGLWAQHQVNIVEYGQPRALNILPSVGVTSDGFLVINYSLTSFRFTERIQTIHLEPCESGQPRYALFVNEQRISGLHGVDYIDRPILSHFFVGETPLYAVGGTQTAIIIDKEEIVNYEVDFTQLSFNEDGDIMYGSINSEVNKMPDIRIHQGGINGFWIIGGISTFYRVSGSFTAPQLRINADNFLVINGQVTHFVFEVYELMGGAVDQLPLEALLLTLILCILSLPLIRIFKVIVPWTKGKVVLIKGLIKKEEIK